MGAGAGSLAGFTACLYSFDTIDLLRFRHDIILIVGDASNLRALHLCFSPVGQMNESERFKCEDAKCKLSDQRISSIIIVDPGEKADFKPLVRSQLQVSDWFVQAAQDQPG